MKTLFRTNYKLTGPARRQVPLLLWAAVLVTLFTACQKPFIPAQRTPSPGLPFTALVDYRRSNYLPMPYPDSLALLQKISLNGAPVSTLLRSGDHLLFATLQGYLYSLNTHKFSARYKTRLAKAVSTAPAYRQGLLALAAEKGTYGLSVYDLLHQHSLWREEGQLSRSSPIILDSLLLHLSLQGELSAFNLHSGKRLWHTSTGHKVFSDAAGDEHLIVVVSRDGRLQAFTPHDGALLWQLPLQGSFYVPPLLNKSVIFVAAYSGRCWAVQRSSGKILWEFSTASPILAPLAADEERLYVIPADGLCRALNIASGQEIWSYRLPAPLSAAPLVTSGKLWLGTSQKTLVALDKYSGRLLQNIELPGRPLTAPLLVDDKVFIGCEYRTLAVYGTKK